MLKKLITSQIVQHLKALSYFKNDTVKAKNAEITNYGFMHMV